MAREIFSKDEESFLKILIDNRVEFMIVGLGAATLQGAPVVTQDIDLWFKDLTASNFRKAVKESGAVFVPSIGHNPPALAGNGVELFDIVLTLSGLGTFESEQANIVQISFGTFSVPVLSLERIIASKRAANRAKDRLTLPVLEDTLKVTMDKKR